MLLGDFSLEILAKWLKTFISTTVCPELSYNIECGLNNKYKHPTHPDSWADIPSDYVAPCRDPVVWRPTRSECALLIRR